MCETYPTQLRRLQGGSEGPFSSLLMFVNPVQYDSDDMELAKR
jgi:hypothetical protein